jgi:hypothetical protein
MRLKYYVQASGRLVDAGEAKVEEDWYHHWLMIMIEAGEERNDIFFFVTETTDVFEEPVPKRLNSWVEILKANLSRDDAMGEAITCSMHALGLFLKDFEKGLTPEERKDAEWILGRVEEQP